MLDEKLRPPTASLLNQFFVKVDLDFEDTDYLDLSFQFATRIWLPKCYLWLEKKQIFRN